MNQVLLGDSLELMKGITDKSVDLLLTDPPYGTTVCKWDCVVSFELLWTQLHRIVKPGGALIFTASQPFTSQLINSNLSNFRYELIWEKDKGSNPLLANKMPMKSHENICIFYRKLPIYNPQWTYSTPYTKKQGNCTFGETVGYGPKPTDKSCEDGRRFPKSVIKLSRDMNRNKENNHPTQKPVALMEWLIKTYTNEGDLILDPFAGSFTTAVAAINTNRKFICIEKEEKYYKIGLKRLGYETD